MNAIILSKSFSNLLISINTVKVNNTEYNIQYRFKYVVYNYFTLRGKVVSYHPIPENQQFNECGTWKREGRREMKLYDFVNDYMIFCLDVNDEDIIKKITNRYIELIISASKAKEKNLNILYSSDIESIYNLPTSENAGSYLKNSCMRSDSNYNCREYAKFYNFIPGLQIMYNVDSENQLLWRALLWECEYKGEKIKFIDRIYGDDEINCFLIEYAIENNFAYRKFSNNNIYYKDEVINLSCPVLDEGVSYLEDEGSPYIDTLCRFNTDTNILSNYMGNVYIQSCEGTALNREVCSCCGWPIHEDTIYHDPNNNILCPHCFHDNYFICDYCGEVCSLDEQGYECYCIDCSEKKGYYQCVRCGDWEKDCYFIDDDAVCEHCLNKYYAYCEHCEQYYEGESYEVHLNNGHSIYVCEYCKNNDYYECNKCGNIYEDVHMVNGVYYCTDCLPENPAQHLLIFSENQTI